VIRITLTGLGYPELTLQEALNRKLNILTEEAGLPVTEGTPGNRLEYLIAGLSSKAKVVVLIDEYDAPVIHHLGKDLGKAIEARDILKEFYTVLKNNDHLLEFVFLTGVSKFSKVGIFSGLNNLQDISLHPAYANMLGYTQQELEGNFAEEITAAAELMRLSREELLAKMKYWYNGYRFHLNSESVYNPISVNLFFNTGEF
ncbi:MAG TPA: AAA family ATPase, partial [Saprospiraceae bacterium]|nr:AAA family ATPase [Saprospiraceae bacterium]